MNRCAIVGMSGLLLYLATASGPIGARPPAAADELFREGRFAEAEALYAKIANRDGTNNEAALRLGTIALFRNQLAEAEKRLTRALAMNKDGVEAKRQLALVYYRRDDFAKAAPLFRDLGLEAEAKKLESFGKEAPYEIDGPADQCRIPFVHTDPLPLIRVKVDGEEANFLIDTGGSEVFIDPELAKKVGATLFGSTKGTYGGGRRAETGQGRVGRVTLGDYVIRNVPVLVLSTRPFAVAARGKRVDGILGTVLLSHFLATLDYPESQLVLRRKTAAQLREVEERVRSDKASVVPFWMAGDHYVVAPGQVNKAPPSLFFVDTGLAGAGFTCPRSVLREAGVKLPEGKELEGVGGGGKVRLVPFQVEALSLGDVKATNVQAFAGVFPEDLEHQFGFRIGGLISHQFFRKYAVTFDFSGMRVFMVGPKQ